MLTSHTRIIAKDSKMNMPIDGSSPEVQVSTGGMLGCGTMTRQAFSLILNANHITFGFKTYLENMHMPKDLSKTRQLY